MLYRRVSPKLLILVLVFSLVTGCAGKANLPPGWQVIRPLEGVLAMVVQGDTLWAGTKEGVYALDRKSGAIIKKLKTDPPLTYVKALRIDRSGTLFIGHFNGLTSYDGANYRTYTTADGLPDNRVNALMLDRHGRI